MAELGPKTEVDLSYNQFIAEGLITWLLLDLKEIPTQTASSDDR